MPEDEIGPEILHDALTVVGYEEERLKIAQAAGNLTMGGIISLVIGVAEIVNDGYEKIGNLAAGLGLMAVMLGGLIYGFNEYRHQLRRNNTPTAYHNN